MENITQYLMDEALVIIPALWFIGALLKNTPVVKDWLIPWILVGVGVGSCLLILGVSPESAIQGVLVASAAVTGHQLVKQTTERD